MAWDWSARLRAVAVIWLLVILSYIIIARIETLDDAQIVTGLVLGALTALVIGQVGVSITKKED